MLRNIVKTAQMIPHEIQLRGEAAIEQYAPQALLQRRDEARSWVRTSTHTARTQGADRLFDLQLRALTSGRHLVERAATVPGLRRVEEPARKLIDSIEAAALTPSMKDYDNLPVRDIMKALYTYDHLELLRIRHHESSHKNRKTVLDAIQKELDKRERIATA